MPSDDLARLKHEYAERDRRLAGSDRYSLFNPAHLFLVQQRRRAELRLLRKHGFYPLPGTPILEIGCGDGAVLLDYLQYGAEPGCLTGVDLLPDRVHKSHSRLPHLPLAIADGQRLPFPDHHFKLVMQYTVFSSLLDQAVKQNLAVEMTRVLNRSGGAILWYDYWLNPGNRQTKGIRPAEIRSLFPGCQYYFERVTLAPPLARRIAPLSYTLACFLERMRIFNTHYFVLIKPC